MTVEGAAAQKQKAPPTPKPPKPKGTLQKGMGKTQQTTARQTTSNDGKSRDEKLAEYEADYVKRLEQQKIDEEAEFQKVLEAEAKARSTAQRGTLPKGFEPEPEAPKASKGTLPKDF